MKLYKSLNGALKERESVQALKINVKDKTFPSELLDFPHLTELYLEGNCTDFPHEVSSWKELKILSIKWHLFQGDLSSVFNLESLQNLKIIDTPLHSLILPLGQITSPLRSLTIKGCQLIRLPEEIAMLSDLEEMNLSGNELTSLPVSLMDLKKLKRLNLDDNKFKEFPNHIKRLPALAHLSIDRNHFDEEELARIQRNYHIWPN